MEICITSNQEKYTKAFDTELMTDQWKERVGNYGNAEEVTKILRGEMRDEDIMGLTEGAKMLIMELKVLDNMIMPESNVQRG